MDIYLFTLSLGFGGLLLMTLLGFGHGGHAVHGGHSHGGAGHGHGPSHGGTHHGTAATRLHAGRSGGKDGKTGRDHSHLLGLLSPRVLFGLLFGFGATGLLVHPLIHFSLVVAVLALAGAWAFERGLVQPLQNFLLNFASKPAQTLDTLVLEEGQAATDFDRSGHGLVAVDLDGQTRQILGTLCAEERGQGARVRTGDRLFIRAVDGARNTCTVSRLAC